MPHVSVGLSKSLVRYNLLSPSVAPSKYTHGSPGPSPLCAARKRTGLIQVTFYTHSALVKIGVQYWTSLPDRCSASCRNAEAFVSWYSCSCLAAAAMHCQNGQRQPEDTQEQGCRDLSRNAFTLLFKFRSYLAKTFTGVKLRSARFLQAYCNWTTAPGREWLCAAPRAGSHSALTTAGWDQLPPGI